MGVKKQQPSEPRYCLVCGKEIAFISPDTAANYACRKYCRAPKGQQYSECYKIGVGVARNQPANKESAKARSKRDGESVKGAVAKVEPYKPRPRKLFLTDAEQAKIDRDCLERDARRMGLTRDPGRSLSEEEKDALWDAGEITHISKIPDRVLSDVDYPGLVQSWCDAGARRWVRG